MMYDTGNYSSELCLPGGGTSSRPKAVPKAVAQYSSSDTVVLDASTPTTVTFDATPFQRGIVPITYSEFKVTTAGVYLLWAEVMIGHEAGSIIPGHKANSWFTVNDVPVAGTGGHLRGLSLAEAGIIAQAVVQLAAGDKIKLRLAGIKAQMEPFNQPGIPAAPAASMTIQEI